MAISTEELRQSLKAVRSILDKLESKLDPAPPEAVDPYTRRRQILQRIYWNQNAMTYDELVPILEGFGTNYAWIGQQVKKGYLLVALLPGGGSRYSVTPKALREQNLQEDDREEIDAVSALSHESFAEDWENDEDAAYDAL